MNAGLERLAEAHGLGGDDVHQRTALDAGKHLRVDFFRELLLAKDDAAARAAQRLVGGGGDEIGVRHRARVHTRGDQTGDVRHVHKQIGADLAGEFAHALEIDDARIGGGPDGDERRLELAGGFFQFVVVDALVVRTDAVVGDVIEAAGEIRLVAVGEVAAVGEIHGEDLVAGLEHGEINGHVRLRAGVRLDVGVLGAEDFLRAVDGELFDDIDVFAAAIPAFAGVAFGVFVSEQRSLRLHHGGRGEVFRSDQLDVVALAVFLGGDGGENLGIHLFDAAAGGFAHAGLVAAALEGGGEERVRHGDGGGGIGVFAAQAEHVRVVMLAGDEGFLHRADVGGTDMAVAVGGDAHADARGAGQNAEIIGAIRDVAGDEVCEVGIIDGFAGVGSEVMDFVTAGFQMRGDGVFEIDGTVIGCRGRRERWDGS